VAIDDRPNWTFRIEEVSAGIYLAIGTDSAGRRFEKKGVDPDQLEREFEEFVRSRAG
jgi:hypothetical protein